MSRFTQYFAKGIRPVYIVKDLTEGVPKDWQKQWNMRSFGKICRLGWRKAFWTAGAFGYYHTTDQKQSKWIPALASMPYLGYNLSRDVANRLNENRSEEDVETNSKTM